MSVHAFTGGAGCGKTHQLLEALTAHLAAVPLHDGQRVLALTYMHGSRQRLHERLGSVTTLARRYECITLDSFAWRIVQRWKSMLVELDVAPPGHGDYSNTCAAAARLLQDESIVRWVARSFPVLLVDEAQDLDVPRVNMIRALSAVAELFVAADEFQCLDPALRPNPACEWLSNVGYRTELTIPQRTKVQPLLDAAAALRNRAAPEPKGLFDIVGTYNIAMAGTWLAGALTWYGRGKSVAVITPSANGFASQVVDWVAKNTTPKGHGPFNITWERSDHKLITAFLSKLTLSPNMPDGEVSEMIKAAGNHSVLADVKRFLDRQRRANGQRQFDPAEIEAVIRQSFAARRRTSIPRANGFRAMTIHGAKNREFDNVIVLWPASVGGMENEQSRRLLYNAVTRAKSRCLVLVQSKKALEKCPFVA